MINRLLLLALCASASATNIYISNTPGGDGLSPDNPVGWVTDVQSIIRDVRARGGDVQAVLFERGDTFTTGLGAWTTSRIRIGAYGDEQKPRPVFRCDKFVHTSGGVDDLIIEDIDAQHVGVESNGFQMLGHGARLTIRNCRVSEFARNINVQGNTGRWTDVLIEDCVVLDATSAKGQAQGIYVENADGIRIVRTVFDRNGTMPSTQSHAVYVHALCTDLEVRSCVFSRSAATGLQARPGGVVSDNVFIANPVSLSYGYVLGGSDPTPGGVAGSIERNVIVHGRDITATLIRGIGMQIANLQPGVAIRDNLIAHSASAQPWESAMQFYMEGSGVGISQADVSGNAIIDWNAVLFLLSKPMPPGFAFHDNTLHRVRYPVYHPMLFMRSYQDDAWRKAAVSANLMIESVAGRVYTGPGTFEDYAGLRGGQYDAGWMAKYFRYSWDFVVPIPEPEPEPEPEPPVVGPAEMTITIPESVRRLVINIP